MGLMDIFRRAPQGEAVKPQAMAGEAVIFSGLDDPRLLEFIRGGSGTSTAAGVAVTPEMAMRNTAVLRSVLLISNSIAMLPLHLRFKDTKEKATEHPLFRLLHRKPNGWMTAFEFRQIMQKWALVDGDAIARKVYGVGGKVTALLPVHRSRWTVEQTPIGGLRYIVKRKDASDLVLSQDQVLHIRGPMADDGISGMSLVRQAAEAIALAVQTERAAARLFENGVIVGQAFKHPGKLSPEAFARLQASIAERAGAKNAHKSIILEEGMSTESAQTTGKDSQALEQRQHQIEEIGRGFGVPRPLLGMDDTSWGSGIDVLGQMFVQYGLNPWFEAWQQAIERDLLSDADAETYEVKFNPGGLLRGSMQAQAEFFAKALGSGGHQPWMVGPEVRDAFDLPVIDNLPAAAGQNGGGNEPA